MCPFRRLPREESILKDQDKKIEAGEIAIENRFLKWLDNYWYHYKWHTIIIGFFVIMGLFTFAQCANREQGDLTVSYAGGYTLNSNERANIVKVLGSLTLDETDQEGELSILLNSYSIYTDAELRVAYTDEKGELAIAAYNNAKQVSLDHFQTFSTYLMTGDSAVWLVSEYVYRDCGLDFAHIARPLADVYGENLPASAYDAYAIRLSDTDLYRYYDALKVLPEDTLLLLPRSYVWGESAKEESYRVFETLFRAIVDFKVADKAA